MKTSTKTTPTKPLTQKLIDATCATIVKGGRVSELAFLLSGYTRAQMDELYAAVTRRIRISKAPMGIREVQGVPVYGDTEWWLSGRGPRKGHVIVGREKELYELADQGLAVTLRNRRSRRYIELPELMAEVAAAKELLAG